MESKTQSVFRLLHATMLSTFLTKNTAYGDSFKKRGYIGVLTRLEDKIARIDSLVAKGLDKMGDESLIDTHMDAAVYNVLAVLCLMEDADKRALIEAANRFVDFSLPASKLPDDLMAEHGKVEE